MIRNKKSAIATDSVVFVTVSECDRDGQMELYIITVNQGRKIMRRKTETLH